MDRAASFDQLALDSPMLVKLEALAKLSLGSVQSLEGGSSIIPPPATNPLGPGALFARATWGPLDDIHLQFQRDGWAYFDRFRNLGAFVLSLDVPSRKDRFEHLSGPTESVLLQNNHQSRVIPIGARAEDFQKSRDALPEQYQLLEKFAGKGLDLPVFVPDTNALMNIAVTAADGAPARLDWERLAAGHPRILIVVVPPVVLELDELKRNRDERRRALAQAAISALWSIRLTPRGYPAWEVARDTFVDFLASEPNAAEMNFLSWLDSNRPDHRVIASSLDVARRFLADQVALITGDLNMALVAGFAGLRALKLGEQMPSDDPE